MSLKLLKLSTMPNSSNDLDTASLKPSISGCTIFFFISFVFAIYWLKNSYALRPISMELSSISHQAYTEIVSTRFQFYLKIVFPFSTMQRYVLFFIKNIKKYL